MGRTAIFDHMRNKLINKYSSRVDPEIPGEGKGNPILTLHFLTLLGTLGQGELGLFHLRCV